MQVADNSIKTLNSIEDLKTVRVTQVANFSKCPARWRGELLGLGTPSTSKYAAIGTALHAVIERYLRGDVELFTKEWEDQMLWLDSAGVSPKERLALLSYIQRHLAPIRNRCIAIEDEFRLPLVEGAPDIVGHRDCLFEDAETIVIRDHKSNRQFEGVDHWRSQFQPLLYALGTAVQYPKKTIVFEIGYIILGEVVRWEITPEEMKAYADYLTARYAEMWEEVRIYKRTGHWPERINEGCYHCPMREQCPTLQWAHKDFLWSFERRDDLELGQKFEWVKDVQSSINAKVEELKQQLIEEIKSNDGQGLYVGDKLYSLKKSRRRSVEFPSLYQRLWNVTQTLPQEQQSEMWQRVSEKLGTMVSVKLGELDDFLLSYPQYRLAIEEIVETVESDSLSLQISNNPLKGVVV